MNHVRVGIVGLGNMGGFHASYINTIDGAQLAAVCDADAKRVEKLAVGGVAGFNDVNAMIASGKIDVKPLITDRFAFKDSVVAFDFAKAMPPASVKVQIELPG